MHRRVMPVSRSWGLLSDCSVPGSHASGKSYPGAGGNRNSTFAKSLGFISISTAAHPTLVHAIFLPFVLVTFPAASPALPNDKNAAPSGAAALAWSSNQLEAVPSRSRPRRPLHSCRLVALRLAFSHTTLDDNANRPGSSYHIKQAWHEKHRGLIEATLASCQQSLRATY